MKRFVKSSVALSVVVILLASMCFMGISAATGTGYTKASDVQYSSNWTIKQYSGEKAISYEYTNITSNWGVRGETCGFLSSKAEAFYKGENAFDKLSELKGNTDPYKAHTSAIYGKLQTVMTNAHKRQTTYGDLRYLFGFTDCEKNNTDYILSFYSAKQFKNVWDNGNTWNREHVWPASKSNSGRPSNQDPGEAADILMVRPTLKAENEAENNAFGEGNKQQDVDKNLRGDVARILLYTYVRWGNYENMWDNTGVMSDMNTLLRWMQEDPVDTWEMGRNDSVQSITGTRNVFVDYPEFAWLLFGKSVPTNYTTPSGEAKKGVDVGTAGGSNDNSSVNNNSSDSNQSSDRVDDDREEDTSSNTSTESGVGAIDNKPQNEGKPFDPSLLGGTTVEDDGDASGIEAWMIIVPIAVLAAAGIAVAVVIIIKKKKVK